MRLLIIAFFCLMNQFLNSQCISGDCDNGYGTAQFEKGDKYEGNFKNGIFNGDGKYYFADGNTYEGEFTDGQITGQGKLFISDGTIYSGIFLKGILSGLGEIYFKNADIYKGEIKNNLPHGKGELIWSDGSIYTGEFFEGQRTGQGEQRNSDSSYYIGSYLNDLYEGIGTYKYADGTRYDGLWLKNKQNGQGKIIYSDGIQFIGEFSNDQKNGKGILIYPSGAKLEGIWKNDVCLTGINDMQVEAGTTIPLIPQSGGTYEIKAFLNDATYVFLMMDTGASESSVSADIILTLIRAKSISDKDFIGEKEYMTASGDIIKSSRVRLQSIKIGDYYLNDIIVSISEKLEAPLLLGQNALSQMGRIILDYNKHTLTIID